MNEVEVAYSIAFGILIACGLYAVIKGEPQKVYTHRDRVFDEAIKEIRKMRF
jgi:hypothetical protein